MFLIDRVLGDLVTLSARGLLRLGSNNKAVAATPSLITLDMLISCLNFLNLSFQALAFNSIAIKKPISRYPFNGGLMGCFQMPLW